MKIHTQVQVRAAADPASIEIETFPSPEYENLNRVTEMLWERLEPLAKSSLGRLGSYPSPLPADS